MTHEDTTVQLELKITLTKRNGETFEILVSPKDWDLAQHHWSAMIGPNGQVYAHRTVDGEKVYLGPIILARKLKDEGIVFQKGQRCYHIDGDTRNKTRDNLDCRRPKKK